VRRGSDDAQWAHAKPTPFTTLWNEHHEKECRCSVVVRRHKPSRNDRGRRNGFAITRGCKVDWSTYPMPHSVCEEEIHVLRAWLGTRLAASS
jgi:hypothetical protein